MSVERCLKCGEALAPGFSFCEACGMRVGGADRPDRAAPVSPGFNGTQGEPGAGTNLRCACGCADFDVDGFCSSCGRKRSLHEAAEVATLGNRAATATHRGRRHPDNQDAVGMIELPGGVALAVADGVSTSWHARQAADTAVNVALAELRDARGERTLGRLSDALKKAHQAICRLDFRAPETRLAEPQATLVLALIEGDRLSYAWVGDSRLYLLAGGERALLTEDDSWLNEQTKAGVPWQIAMRDANAHCITQCLGMRDAEPVIHTGERLLRADSWLLLCSDGLWNYLAEPSALWAQLEEGRGAAPLSSRCMRLVDYANAAGGQDNISVALYRPLISD